MAIKYSHISKGTKRLRAFLIIVNGLCFFLSAAVIIVGTYLVAERLQFVASVYGTQILAAAGYLSISAGCVLFLITFIGCFGALFYNRTLLLIYGVIVSLVFLLGVLVAVLALVFQYQVYSVVKVYMRESLLITYGTNMDDSWNNFVTRSWDEIQQKLECCALDRRGWMIYRQTFWYRDLPGLQGYEKPYVPWSCCKRQANSRNFVDLILCQFNSDGPPGLPPYRLMPINATQSNYNNPALLTQGCYAAGRDVLLAVGKYFIAIGFVMAAIVSGLIAASFVMYDRL